MSESDGIDLKYRRQRHLFEDYDYGGSEGFNLTLDFGNNFTGLVNFTADVVLLEEYSPSLLYFGVACCIGFTILGIPGNIITIIALLRSPRLRNATCAFLVNLCFADVLYCCFTIPLSAVTLLHKGWPYGHNLCVIFAISRYSNAAVLTLTIVSITVNRYVLIVHPNLYERIYTKVTITVSIVLIWMMPFVLLAPTAAKKWGAFTFDPQIGECTIVPLKGKSSKKFIYIFLFTLATVTLLYCYIRIFYTVRKSEMTVGSVRSQVDTREGNGKSWLKRLNCCESQAEESQKRRRRRRQGSDLKLLRVILVIFITSILCYLPHWYVKVWKQEEGLPIMNILGFVGQYFSACINPFIYVAMSEEYRKAYRNFFTCSDHRDTNSVSRS